MASLAPKSARHIYDTYYEYIYLTTIQDPPEFLLFPGLQGATFWNVEWPWHLWPSGSCTVRFGLDFPGVKFYVVYMICGVSLSKELTGTSVNMTRRRSTQISGWRCSNNQEGIFRLASEYFDERRNFSTVLRWAWMIQNRTEGRKFTTLCLTLQCCTTAGAGEPSIE